MGINIVVESVVCPRSRYPAQTLYQRQSGWREVKAICQALRWDKLPWEDPSEQHGLRASTHYSRYTLLLHIAQVADGGVKGHFARFPHLLERDVNTTIYAPIELAYPVHTKWTHDGASSKTLTLGSSLHLMDELEQLQNVLDEMMDDRGRRAKVAHHDNFAGHTWGDVQNLCATLLKAAQDSQTLNLPFCIRY